MDRIKLGRFTFIVVILHISIAAYFFLYFGAGAVLVIP